MWGVWEAQEGGWQDAAPQAVWTTVKAPSSQHSYPYSRAAPRVKQPKATTFTQPPQDKLKPHGEMAKARMDPDFVPLPGGWCGFTKEAP